MPLIINEEGEIINEIYYGDRIVRKKSIKNFNKIKQKTKMEGDFIVSGQSNGQLLSKLLSNIEISFLRRVCDYMKFNNCMLYKDQTTPIRTIQDFMDITLLSKQSVRKIIKKFVEAHIMFKTNNRKNNYYFINPYIYFKGNKIPDSIIQAKDYYNVEIEIKLNVNAIKK